MRSELYFYLLLFLLTSVRAEGHGAEAELWCVNPGGGDGCVATIGAALALAKERDIIRVASWLYTEKVLISQTVTLQEG